jgi:GTP-binding protein
MPAPLRNATFLRAVTDARQAPEPRPAVVLAGRSHGGKSSLINRLTGRKGLARTSNTPGRTREIIFFEVNDGAGHLIDLPGYGYAKVSESERRRWGPMIERFLREATGLRLIVLILDVRRHPSPEDVQMLQWLLQGEVPFVVAATKIDKLGGNQRRNQLKAIAGALGLDQGGVLLPVSSQTGDGIDALLAVIEAALTGPPPEE